VGQLDAADQAIVKQAALDAAKEEIAIARKGLVEPDKPLLKDLAGLGVTVTDLNAASARCLSRPPPVYDKWKPQIGANLVDMAEKAIAASRK
jgi:TRAP-type C4-dicarboxylate transport system substrate-binding protein